MPRKKKTQLVLIETDANGKKTEHVISGFISSNDIELDKWWVEKAISRQQYEDNQPEPGMGSGCW
jgi:hypothetical protein